MAYSYNLENIIEEIESFGVYDVVLPFLLIFVLSYAILNKINIFAKENKKVNVIVSLVIALTTVTAHVTNFIPKDYDVVEVINTVVPSITMIIVAVLGLLLVVGVLGGESKKGKDFAFFLSMTAFGLMAIIYVNSIFPNASLLIPIASILIIVYTAATGKEKEPGATVAGGIAVISFALILFFFGHETGLIEEIPWWLEDEAAIIILIIVAVIASAVAFITRE